MKYFIPGKMKISKFSVKIYFQCLYVAVEIFEYANIYEQHSKDISKFFLTSVVLLTKKLVTVIAERRHLAMTHVIEIFISALFTVKKEQLNGCNEWLGLSKGQVLKGYIIYFNRTSALQFVVISL